uniref:Chain A Crystal Structure Of Poplar Glutaredoxin S12 In Complex With Glutathione n=1 Tax=Rhizophora mucronata TaxID=61149 RepID=A0A2P2LQG3_RHIMU
MLERRKASLVILWLESLIPWSSMDFLTGHPSFRWLPFIVVHLFSWPPYDLFGAIVQFAHQKIVRF